MALPIGVIDSEGLFFRSEQDIPLSISQLEMNQGYLQNLALAMSDSSGLVYTSLENFVYGLSDSIPTITSGSFLMQATKTNSQGEPIEIAFIFPNADSFGDKIGFWEKYVDSELEQPLATPSEGDGGQIPEIARAPKKNNSTVKNSVGNIRRSIRLSKISGDNAAAKTIEFEISGVSPTGNGDGYVVFGNRGSGGRKIHNLDVRGKTPPPSDNLSSPCPSCGKETPIITVPVTGKLVIDSTASGMGRSDVVTSGDAINVDSWLPQSASDLDQWHLMSSPILSPKSLCPSCNKKSQSTPIGPCSTSEDCPPGYICSGGVCQIEIFESDAKYVVSIVETTDNSTGPQTYMRTDSNTWGNTGNSFSQGFDYTIIASSSGTPSITLKFDTYGITASWIQDVKDLSKSFDVLMTILDDQNNQIPFVVTNIEDKLIQSERDVEYVEITGDTDIFAGGPRKGIIKLKPSGSKDLTINPDSPVGLSTLSEIPLNSLAKITYYPIINSSTTGLIPSNGSFWSFRGTDYNPMSITTGQFYNLGTNDNIVVGEQYVFNFNQYDYVGSGIDYSTWFEYLFLYGDSGLSVLHLVQYENYNTDPTGQIVARGDFKIDSFGDSPLVLNVTCIAGSGKLSSLDYLSNFSPSLYFVSYTIVSSVGGGGGGVGPQGLQGPQGGLGPTGDFGPQGLTGPPGGFGPQGITGPKGDVGTQGPRGPEGGPQGFQGHTGPQAPAGGTRVDTFNNVLAITVSHTFGPYPQVQLLDQNNEVFIPERIVHNSTSNFTVNFSTTSSGKVITSAGGPRGGTGVQGPTGAAGVDSQMRAYYSDDDGLILGGYSLSPTLVALPEGPGYFGVQLYSSYTINVGSTQTFYFYGSDFGGTNRYEFFYPLQYSGVTRNTLRMTGAINNEFRVNTISYDGEFNVWTIDTTTIVGTTSTLGGSLIGFGRTELSYRLNSASGSLVITTQSVPTYSKATGQYGETRLGLSGSTPYLYVYTDQWYRFIGATF